MKLRLPALLSLLAAVPALAVTDMWDGNSPNAGAGDSNISTALNWADDSAPVSDLVNTDLIFAGTTKLLPNFSVAFSTDSITFNSTAGGFTLLGQPLTLGTTGITNNDVDTQTIINTVNIGTATSTFNAAGGGINCSGTVALGTNALTLSGGSSIFLGAISGTGSINKSGAGALTIFPTAATLSADLALNNGATTVAPTGTPLTVLSNGSITTGLVSLILNENVIFDAGAQFSRNSLGSLTVAAGKTLTFQGGSDGTSSGSHVQTGGNLLVTGAGSTFSTTASGSFTVAGNATASVLAGGSLTSPGGLNVGNATGAGTLAVGGPGSSVAVTAGAASFWGSSANDATVTLSNNAQASLAAVSLASTAGAGITTTVDVLTGADVTSSNLNIASVNSSHVATVTVDGSGSSWIQNGTAFLAIGANLLESGTLNVRNGGNFFSSAGLAAIHPTGTLAIAGGSYTANGSVTVNGGQLTRDAAGTFTLASGRSLVVQNGGDATFTGGLLLAAINGSAAAVNGAGSTFNVPGGTLSTGNSFDLSVSNGGSVTADGLSMGGGTFGDTASITGSGSSLSVTTLSAILGNVDFAFSNNSTGTLGGVVVDPDALSLGGAVADCSVESGADVTAGNTSIGTGTLAGAGNVSRLTVTGAGSTYSQNGAAVLTIGSAVLSNGTGAVNVATGGIFNSGTGTVTVRPSGTINITGGTLNLRGPLVVQQLGVLNFDHGALAIVDPFLVGTGGLLGENVTLDAAHHLTTSAAATIDPFRTLTLAGGMLRAASLTNNGMLDFQSGTLAITGAGGFNIGTGALGANVTLRDGALLDVTNVTIVNSGATLRFDGGSIATDLIDTFGTVRVDRGTVTPDVVFVRGGGRLFVADTLAFAANGSHSLLTGSRLTLENGGLVTGAGALGSDGLVTGDGTIALSFFSSGEVRAEAGKTLYFTAGTGTHVGRCNLQGGTLFFSQPFNNHADGQINGHGELYFPATPVPTVGAPLAGLNNDGAMNLSGGDSLIFGTVAVNGHGKVIASGGATATFFDIFRHSGAEVKASAGSALVFFGEVRGPGSFTGTGTIYMEGGYSPGASPASVSLAPQMVFTESNVLTMEIGGLTAGTQHDKLTFTHATAPQVTWGGTLAVTLINGFTPAAGQSFDVFDFDAARDAGTFAVLNLPPLTAGLLWDTTQLYSTGVITVVTEGLTFAQWATASGIPGALPSGDHDSDGYDNATEFALGLFPPQPGSAEPNGGFFTYVEGERLRLLFTRPLDRTGVTLKVQASDDLVVWDDLAISVNSAVFTGPGFVSENRAHPLTEPGLVEVRDILNTATIPRRQLRLHISLSP